MAKVLGFETPINLVILPFIIKSGFSIFLPTCLKTPFIEKSQIIAFVTSKSRLFDIASMFVTYKPREGLTLSSEGDKSINFSTWTVLLIVLGLTSKLTFGE